MGTLNTMHELYIGVMTGTSVDAIDVALIACDAHNVRLLASHGHPFPEPLRAEVIALCQTGPDEIERLGRLDRQLARLMAEAVLALLDKTGISADQIRAIGSHGQTVRHRPEGQDGFTLQLGDANTLALLTGIAVVADFRRRDIALGGQGAPLVPAFHKAVFQSEQESRVIVNLGGIANITVLPKDPAAPVFGYDTGPANTLLDAWSLRHRGTVLDDGGRWAASGQADERLLTALLKDDYFARPAPKSTGREYFHLAWLDSQLAQQPASLPAHTVQATLLELTARSVADAVHQALPTTGSVFLCGGGVHNHTLVTRLQALLPQLTLSTTDALGVGADWVEAMAFAWLAQRYCHGLPGNLPEVTGASRAAVLGGYYPS